LPLWKRNDAEEIMLWLALSEDRSLDNYLHQNEGASGYLAQEKVEKE